MTDTLTLRVQAAFPSPPPPLPAPLARPQLSGAGKGGRGGQGALGARTRVPSYTRGEGRLRKGREWKRESGG